MPGRYVRKDESHPLDQGRLPSNFDGSHAGHANLEFNELETGITLLVNYIVNKNKTITV